MYLCKYIELLHINSKRKILPFKLLKTKLKAAFATPKKFAGGADDDLPCLFHLWAVRYGNIIF